MFGQLRRIARNVQNESALAQERMSRPIGLRTSGDSARPVLRRMQADAHNVKVNLKLGWGAISAHLTFDSALTRIFFYVPVSRNMMLLPLFVIF